jgi:hypothetical protein
LLLGRKGCGLGKSSASLKSNGEGAPSDEELAATIQRRIEKHERIVARAQGYIAHEEINGYRTQFAKYLRRLELVKSEVVCTLLVWQIADPYL